MDDIVFGKFTTIGQSSDVGAGDKTKYALAMGQGNWNAETAHVGSTPYLIVEYIVEHEFVDRNQILVSLAARFRRIGGSGTPAYVETSSSQDSLFVPDFDGRYLPDAFDGSNVQDRRIPIVAIMRMAEMIHRSSHAPGCCNSHYAVPSTCKGSVNRQHYHSPYNRKRRPQKPNSSRKGPSIGKCVN
jgi:hypothetical protein